MSSLLILQDFAESQQLSEEIEKDLKKHVSHDLGQIKWAIYGTEIGIEDHDIDFEIDHDTPLHKTHIIFLEKGNIFHGLRQIYDEHRDEFERIEGIVDEENVSQFIKHTMETKDLTELRPSVKGEIEVLYETKTGHFLRVIAATNGSIITAYPISSRGVEWQISIDQAGIRQDIALTTLNPATHFVWLREGNIRGGLKHIHSKHGGEFKSLQEISSKEWISIFIKSTMTMHDPFEVKSVKRTTLVTYRTNEDNYLIVCIGPNGFIITAFMEKGFPIVWKITTTEAGINTKPNSRLLNVDTITLVEGVGNRGLRYTVDQHGGEFKLGEGAGEEKISEFIKKAMVRNMPLHVEPTVRGGVDVLYRTTENKLLRVLIMKSGFISTAYPVESKDTEWTIKTDQAGITKTKSDQTLIKMLPCAKHIPYI